jgi:ABC-type branched-subunit amino acid transport system substrate-binding protein
MILLAQACGTSAESRQSGMVPTTQNYGNKAPKMGNYTDSNTERTQYFKLQQDFVKLSPDANSDALALITRINQFVSDHPRSRYAAQAENLRGLTYLNLKEWAKAEEGFKQALALTRSESTLRYLRYNLAAAQYEQNKLSEATATLEGIRGTEFDAVNRVKFHLLRSRIQKSNKQVVLATEELFEGARALTELDPKVPFVATSYATFDREIQLLMEMALVDDSELVAVAEKYPDSPIGGHFYYRLAKKADSKGDREATERFAQLVVSNYAQSPVYPDAKDLLSNQQSQREGDVEKDVVGFLLPMKGKYARFGERVMDALQLSLGFYTNPKKPPISVVVEDAGETTESTLKALERLVNVHKVSSVVGPILSKDMDKISLQAQAYGVPMLSLSQVVPPGGGNGILYGGITVEDQVRSLVEEVAKKRLVKRVAIVAPRTPLGRAYAMAFWAEADKNGIEITDYETYSPEETDYRDSLDSMLGLKYPETRADEFRALEKVRKEQNVTKKTRRNEGMFQLPPVYEFDAVFIADDAKIATQIISTFAFRDVENVKWLGISAWNSTILTQQGQGLTEGAIFPFAFSSKFPNARDQIFKQSFENSYGYQPSEMEGTAFDAGKLIAHFYAGGGSSRSKLRDMFNQFESVEGITGRLTREANWVKHPLRFLTVKKKEIVPMDDTVIR